MNDFQIVPNHKKEKGDTVFYIIFIPWAISIIWILTEIKYFMNGIHLGSLAMFVFILSSLALVFYILFHKWTGIHHKNHDKMIDAFENKKINNIEDLEKATGLSRPKIVRLLVWYKKNGWLVLPTEALKVLLIKTHRPLQKMITCKRTSQL